MAGRITTLTYSAPVRTRLAPTPSGFLHRGNVANFALTADFAREHALELGLRIDDVDAVRCRPEYVADIFRVLDLMNITWAFGPRDQDDFAANWSQAARTERYRSALAHEGLAPHLYVCDCSRTRAGRATGGCPGGCREQDLALVTEATSLRLHIPRGTTVVMDDHAVDLAAEVGDVVLWRRDGLPAYHLVTVVEDDALGITHIVRGEDLRASSALHVHLAGLLGLRGVATGNYVHHPLVLDADGRKLSKSTLAQPHPLTRDDITTS